ncbi:MAG: phosphotransferase [Caldilineaceae bacterium]|nr:phosphotransferase [Caldilineaceae bacterium]HRJ42327.1 aminoglycoside phosphotransferase family protein [Caldilineaceae bacterium]
MKEKVITPRQLLTPILGYLAQGVPDQAGFEWQEWRIWSIGGGMNNRLFRITQGSFDLAVKFTIRDNRDRAGREWAALHLLQEAGLSIAPSPLLLDQENYPNPVVVQSWEQGVVSSHPPADDREWGRLLDHLQIIHSIKLTATHRGLTRSVLSTASADEALAAIRAQWGWLSAEARSTDLSRLLDRVHCIDWPSWPRVDQTLCRSDPNIRNFLRRPDGWKSVDWEYSGWCDPAFEIADLITHPAYADVTDQRWEWVIANYCNSCPDGDVERRIQVYTALMLVWWRLRLERYLDDEGDASGRLAERAAGWREEKVAQIRLYEQRCAAALPHGGAARVW